MPATSVSAGLGSDAFKGGMSMGALSGALGFTTPARERHAIIGFGLVAAVVVGALGAARPIVAHASTGTDYPMLGYNATHTSVSPDTTVSASSWDAFTLKHKVALGGFILSSPAVAYNTTLNENVVYVVTSGAPSVAAVNAATGAILWQKPLPQDAYSSPTVFDNTVYFGSEDFNLYAFDATTGALDCTFNTGGRIEASPLVEDIDSTGPTVFFGDTGKSEARNAGHEWALYGVGNSAGAACTERWMFNSWNNTNHGADGGSWSSPALGTDRLGRQLLVFGSNQPDDSVYGLNAATGAMVWRFQTAVGADSDVGAAPTISLPGGNGITDGAVYVMGKDQHEYALDFTTGALYWDFDLSTVNCSSDPVSGTALVGTMVLFNFCKWVYAVSATATGTGTTTLIWRTAASPAHSRASPVVSGGSGNQVVLRPDKGGNIDAYRVSNGSSLTAFNIGSTTTEITASPAVSAGEVFDAGVDGNLYILALGTSPVVSGVSPSSGPPAGGTAVTISGLNLSGATSVTFGGTAAAFTPVSNTEITSTSPAGSGTVDVRVTTGSGTSATSTSDQFTYTTGGTAPIVKTISPTSGPAAGGTFVTITGSNLTGATLVTFAGKAASFHVVSDTEITATSPAHAAGSVSVVVHSPGGISAKSHKFTYV
ncbi:MAG: IPT/TIG domain-containing protein [Candidatus Dormiibacterota bacterium]